MITINEIATELENILNGTSINIGTTKRPIEGLFAVRTEGYHLDNVHDYETGKNFFPVFVGAINGEFNPIPKLGQLDLEVPVSIYFPVRFKNKMLEMVDYLAATLVGVGIKFNLNRVDGVQYYQYAFSNISYPELGEVTDLDLDQFGNSILKGLNEFIAEQYKAPISSSEPWICLNFSWYLENARDAMSNDYDGVMYGNAYQVRLTYDGSETIIYAWDITFAYGAQTESQQGFTLGSGVADKESKSLAVTNATSITFEAVITRKQWWQTIMNAVANGTLDPNKFQFKLLLSSGYKSGTDDDYAQYMSDYRDMVLTDFSTTINPNQIMTARMTFTPKAEVE